ncbi:hypothetical protein GCM10027277_17550 [Pseudoduganella ginsengisoli]|uniref:Uncharacterized protein n=1 Tax=Pseudoduganella ginsengisoli TaxID=1462440 RepID=A0A6L6PVF9_9BURK|nr:hypothetical protein [Pseudoduganella ginsengisoli]MTW00988.1 hypothetical protein [Pseudoduganella ginsengisoli]
MNEDDIKNLWRSAPAAGSVTPLQEADLAKRARRFQRRIAFRNFTEYAAALLVCAGFVFYLWEFPDPLMRAGSLLSIFGTLVVVWQLHRRASSRPMPGEESALPSRDFHRAELVRQRDALRSVWLWYVGPLVPGMVVFRMGVNANPDPSLPFARGWAAEGFIACVILGVILLNLYGAHKLQRQIDQLDQIDS